MDCMSVLGFAACSPDAALRERLPFHCGDIDRNTIPAMLRRRSSQAMQLAFSAATEVCTQTGRSPVELPAIFASVAGEIQTTDQICTELAKPSGLISPSAFHNSVQNTAAGYWSIAQQCTQAASALAGGTETFAMALLEAWCLLACYGGELLLVCYDEVWPDYLASGRGRPAFAAALILAAGAVDVNIARLNKPQQNSLSFPEQWEALAAAMPIAAAIPLIEFINRAERAGQVSISSTSPVWHVDVSF